MCRLCETRRPCVATIFKSSREVAHEPGIQDLEMIEMCRDVQRELWTAKDPERVSVAPTLQGCQKFEESKMWEVE